MIAIRKKRITKEVEEFRRGVKGSRGMVGVAKASEGITKGIKEMTKGSQRDYKRN